MVSVCVRCALLLAAAAFALLRLGPAPVAVGLDAQTSPTCAVPRTPVATLTDPAAVYVSFAPLHQQVLDLANWPAPSTIPEIGRIAGIETHVYDVTAALIGASLEPSGAIDLLLSQPGDRRWTIVGVLADASACAGAAPADLLDSIGSARANYVSLFGVPPSGSFTQQSAIVHVVGAGFFNPAASSSGGAANGLELRPLLSFSLAGPASLSSLPVLPAVAASRSPAPNVYGGGAASAIVPTSSAAQPSQSSAAAAGMEAASPSSGAAQPSSSAAPGASSAAASTAASTQSIADSLASAPLANGELPAGFGGAVLANSGPSTGPAGDEYDLNFVILGSASGQPAGTISYSVFSGSADAGTGFNLLTSLLSQGDSQVSQPSGFSFPVRCAQIGGQSPVAGCGVVAGPVLIAVQAQTLSDAVALAQAAVLHLLRSARGVGG